MSRFVILLALTAALGTACKKPPEAQPSVARDPAAAAVPANKAPANTNRELLPLRRPLLWSAEKDGQVTYLFGTMHAGVDAEAQLPPTVWAKLDAAKSFAMEANLDDPSAAAALRPTGRSLRAELGDVYWKKLEDALGPDMRSAIEHLPAMVPAAALSLRGLPSTPPMDRVLAARAATAHKPIIYLEPAAHQLALLARWMDVRALKMMLDELPDTEQRMQAMYTAYSDGDADRLLEINDAERDVALRHGYTPAEYDQQMDELLYQRNASWIAPIERLHAEGGGFVAVGALHLTGPRSVLDLLARQGYRITRVKP